MLETGSRPQGSVAFAAEITLSGASAEATSGRVAPIEQSSAAATMASGRLSSTGSEASPPSASGHGSARPAISLESAGGALESSGNQQSGSNGEEARPVGESKAGKAESTASPDHANINTTDEDKLVVKTVSGSGGGSHGAENRASDKGPSQPPAGVHTAPVASAARTEPQAASARPHPDPAPAPAPPAVAPPDGERKTVNPVQDIHLRLNAQQESRVDVQVFERSGRLQVAVRTDDPQLQSALRDDIGQLVAKVEDQGLRAEVWTPAGSLPQGNFQGFDARQQAGFSFGESPSGGHSGSGDARQDQRDQRQSRPAWLDQLEETLNFTSKEATKEREWVRILRR
jgi:hypothetical protein